MLILSDQNFEAEVLKSDLPVLVDFYADWCGPCQMYEPIIEGLEGDEGIKGKIKIGKVNVDQALQTAQKYGVMSIPATIFFNKGQVVQTLAGVQTKEALEEEIKKILN